MLKCRQVSWQLVITLFVLASLDLAAWSTPASAQTAETFGAIFFDKDQRKSGVASNKGSQDEADQLARQQCEAAGGQACEFAVEFRGSQCGALADGAHGWAAAEGASKNAASSRALANCGKDTSNCKVVAAACNTSTATAPPPPTVTPTCPAGFVFSGGQCVQTASPLPPPIQTPPPQQPANLAYPLQAELKRIGCLPGLVDGIWGPGSRAALRRFSAQTGLNLGSEPSQQALDETRRRQAGFCQTIRPTPPPQVRPRPVPIKPKPPVVRKPRCSAIKFAFTRGNTCACSGGRIFTGSACIKPVAPRPVLPGPGNCVRIGGVLVCS